MGRLSHAKGTLSGEQRAGASLEPGASTGANTIHSRSSTPGRNRLSEVKAKVDTGAVMPKAARERRLLTQKGMLLPFLSF